MKKQLIYLLINLIMFISGACSSNNTCVREPDYPLTNGIHYQLEGKEFFYEICFWGDQFSYTEPNYEFSCKYKYVHPIVTLAWKDTTYQFYVGENYLRLTDIKGNEHYFYATKQYHPIDE